MHIVKTITYLKEIQCLFTFSVKSDSTCVYMSDWSITAWVRTGLLEVVLERLGPDSIAWERKTTKNIITTISINTTFIYKKYSRTNKSVTNRSIRLLCIQVLFVHLVEFIKHCGHHRQVPFISSCKHWGKRHWFIKHYPNIYFKHHILLYQACLLCEHTDKITILQSRLRNRKSMSLPLSCRRFGVGWSFTWRYHKYPDKQRTYNHSPSRQIGFHLCIV